jgi:hypothetical protein
MNPSFQAWYTTATLPLTLFTDFKNSLPQPSGKLYPSYWLRPGLHAL